MFDAKLNHDSRFFSDGYELSGIENITLSYKNPVNLSKFMGTVNGFATLNGPTNQQVSFSRFLTYSDPVLNYTGENPISGSIYYNDEHYGFESGYLLDYSLNCAVGSVPRVSANFQVADELKSGKSTGMDDNSHPQIDIPTQGSISIEADNASSNRVVGFDYSIKCNRKAYVGVGDKNIIKVESVYPIEYSATVQIDVDDAFMEHSNSFLDKTGERNISINIEGRDGSQIQNLEIPNANLVGESLTASSNGSLKLNLEYLGSIGKDLARGIDYSNTFATDNLDNVIDSRGAIIEDDWLKGNQDVYDLFIGESLNTIGKNAFSGCLNLDYLPSFTENLQYIDDGAFAGCENIESDIFFDGDDLTGIGSFAFRDCSSISENLYLRDSITYIGEGAFKNCKSLNSVVISENLEIINESVFEGCDGFAGTLNIPSGVLQISNRSFSECVNIENVNIGDNVENINDEAFAGCSSIGPEISIPDSVITIGENAFTGCESLYSLSFGESLIEIKSGAFSGCSGISNSISFPKSLETIGHDSFHDCEQINNLDFFDDDILYFNTYEQYKTYGSFPKTERSSTWWNFPGLNNGSFTAGSYNDFESDDDIQIVSTEGNNYLQGTKGLKISTSSNNRYNLVMERFQETGSYYIEVNFETNNCEFRLRINNTVVFSKSEPQGKYYKVYLSFNAGDLLKLEAYNNTSSLEKSVTIGRFLIRKRNRTLIGDDFNLTQIGKRAFEGCKSIDGVINITEGTQVQSRAFKKCEEIKKINFNKDCNVYFEAFQGCSKLKGDIIFHDSTINVGDRSFKDCLSLDGSLYLPSGLVYLGVEAFKNTKFRDNLVISNCTGLYEIPNRAFQYAKFSNQLKLPDSSRLSTIGASAFQGCNFTGDLIMPTGLNNVGANAFYNCEIADVYSDIPHSAYKDANGQRAVYSDIFYGATGTMYVSSRYYDGYINAIKFNNEFGGESEGSNIFQDMPIKRGAFKTQLYRYSDDVVINQDDFDIEPQWNKNNNTNSYIDIDARCRIIGLESFFGSSMTGSLVLPRDLNVINYAAFEGATFGGFLETNEKLQIIEANSFKDCYGFTGSLIMPESLASVGDFAFQNCSGFNGALYLPSGLQNIGRGAFENMTGLDSTIEIPTGISSIRQAAFKNCNLKGRLILPEKLRSIESEAFENNNFSNTLFLPSNVTGVSTRSFKNCPGITKFDYSNRGFNLSIGNSAFEECGGIVQTLTLKSRVINVGVDAFKDCSGIYVCDSYIPETRLSQGSLQFQSQPTSNRVLYVDADNINTYRNPTTIQLASPNYYDGNLIRPKKQDDFNTVYYDQDFNVLDSGKWADYKIPNNWQESGNGSYLDIGKSISDIGFAAFRWNSDMSGVVLFPETLNNISNEAFRGCNYVDNYIINNGLESIGFRSFAGNISVKSWSFTESIQEIRNECFANNTQLRDFVLPGQSLVRLGVISDTNKLSLFNNCHDLEYVNIGNEDLLWTERKGVIKRNAFNYCGRDRVGVGEVIIQGSVDQIGVECFDGTTTKGNYPWIQKADIRARDVKENAFINQTNMTEFKVSNKNRMIQSGALANCSSLEDFTFRGNYLGNYALSGCSSLKNVTLRPDFYEVMEVGAHAFRYAGGSTTSPGVVKANHNDAYSHIKIRNNAFRNSAGNPWIKRFECDANLVGTDSFRDQTLLDDVIIGNNCRYIYTRAFMGCTAMTGDLLFSRSAVKVYDRSFDGCPVNDVYFNTSRQNISGNAFDDMTGTFYVNERIANSWTGNSSVFDNNRPIQLWTSYPNLMP